MEVYYHFWRVSSNAGTLAMSPQIILNELCFQCLQNNAIPHHHLRRSPTPLGADFFSSKNRSASWTLSAILAASLSFGLSISICRFAVQGINSYHPLLSAPLPAPLGAGDREAVVGVGCFSIQNIPASALLSMFAKCRYCAERQISICRRVAKTLQTYFAILSVALE